MKFFSALKLMAVASALCATSVFAAGVLSELASGGDGRNYVTYFKGKGVKIYENARDEQIDYEVTMKSVTLDDGRELIEYNFVSGSDNTYHRFIVDEESDAFKKVFVPASKDTQHDYSSYVETGWGHKIEYENLQREEGTAKKRTILLNYTDMDGNRVTHHILAYKKEDNWKFLSTISVGNADGVIYVAAQELELVIERMPENN